MNVTVKPCFFAIKATFSRVSCSLESCERRRLTFGFSIATSATSAIDLRLRTPTETGTSVPREGCRRTSSIPKLCLRAQIEDRVLPNSFAIFPVVEPLRASSIQR